MEADGSGAAGIPAANAPGLDPTQVFYGKGKADLINAITARGFDFTYLTCETRVGNTLPHHSLTGRWKKRNVLELLIPHDNPKAKPGAKPKFDKCTVDVRMTTVAVYLVLPNGNLARVSLSDYIRKPALHKYSEGVEPGLIPRPDAAPNAPASSTRRQPRQPLMPHRLRRRVSLLLPRHPHQEHQRRQTQHRERQHRERILITQHRRLPQHLLVSPARRHPCRVSAAFIPARRIISVIPSIYVDSRAPPCCTFAASVC